MLKKVCQSRRLFLDGIKSIGIPTIEKLLENNEKWSIVYHGTNSLDNISSICCKSFDLSKRSKNGQQYGPGEYFSDDLKTPLQFSSQGAIIVTLVVMPRVCNKIKIERIQNENYYIINNISDKFYCLPIAIMQNSIDLEFISFSCKT